jgi:hypothetical protein
MHLKASPDPSTQVSIGSWVLPSTNGTQAQVKPSICCPCWQLEDAALPRAAEWARVARYQSLSQALGAADSWARSRTERGQQVEGGWRISTIPAQLTPGSASAPCRYLGTELREPENTEWKAAGVLIYTFDRAGELLMLLGRPDYSASPQENRRNVWNLLGALSAGRTPPELPPPALLRKGACSSMLHLSVICQGAHDPVGFVVVLKPPSLMVLRLDNIPRWQAGDL